MQPTVKKIVDKLAIRVNARLERVLNRGR